MKKIKKAFTITELVIVIAYFTVVAGVSFLLISRGVITAENSFSFVFSTDGIPVFEFLYKLIPAPYFYLYPLLPVLALYFYLLARLAQGRRVVPFRYRGEKKQINEEKAN